MNMEFPIKVSIVGCGAVVQELHGAALSRLQSQGAITVTSLVDPNRVQLERFKSKFSGATAFSNFEEAMRAAPPDVTLVASPPGLHRVHCEAALAAGSHVLCEKPLATTSADADRIANAANASKRIVAVELTRRFFPSIGTAAKMIAEGQLGPELEFVCREGDVCCWPLTSDALFRRATSGGGVLADKGVHVLDSLLAMLGKMSVTAFEDDAQNGGVEGNCRMTMQGERVRGTLHLSCDQSLNNGLSIRGAKGELRLTDMFRHVEVRRPGGQWERFPSDVKWPSSVDKDKPCPVAPRNYDECIGLQWVAMLRAVRYGEKVPVDAAAARIVVAQIEEAYKMAGPMPQNWLAPDERKNAQSRHWNTRP
jgi:predicted dehydrogenase